MLILISSKSLIYHEGAQGAHFNLPPGEVVKVSIFGMGPFRACTHKSRSMSNGWSMSALPLKADIDCGNQDVCYGPRADFQPMCAVVPH